MADNAERLSRELAGILDRGWRISIRQHEQIDGYAFEFFRKHKSRPLRMSICATRRAFVDSLDGMELLRIFAQAAVSINSWREENP